MSSKDNMPKPYVAGPAGENDIFNICVLGLKQILGKDINERSGNNEIVVSDSARRDVKSNELKEGIRIKAEDGGIGIVKRGKTPERNIAPEGEINPERNIAPKGEINPERNIAPKGEINLGRNMASEKTGDNR